MNLEEFRVIYQNKEQLGLNKKQFCDQFDIKLHIYNYWLKKLRDENKIDTTFVELKSLNQKGEIKSSYPTKSLLRSRKLQWKSFVEINNHSFSMLAISSTSKSFFCLAPTDMRKGSFRLSSDNTALIDRASLQMMLEGIEEERTCDPCDSTLKVIGEEIFEELEYIPAKLILKKSYLKNMLVQ